MNNTHALPFNGPNGEAWLVWGLLVALGLGLVVASVIALWRGSRVHKVTFDATKGLDWGKVSGTFLNGKLVSVNYTVGEDIGKDKGKASEDNDVGSIDRGQDPTLPVPPEKQKGKDRLLGRGITTFAERQAAINERSKTGQGGYCLGGVTQQKDTQRNKDV